jgi:hypothetical protein
VRSGGRKHGWRDGVVWHELRRMVAKHVQP